MSFDQQVMIIYAGTQGYLDDLAVESIRSFEEEFLKFMGERYGDVGHDIKNSKDLSEASEKKLKAAIVEFKGAFQTRQKDGKLAAAAR